MATITITGLTAGGYSYSASPSTAAFTETANGIVFVAVQYPAAGPFSVPTKTGLTFSLVGSLDFTAASATRHVALYAARAGGSPSSGAATIPSTSSAHTRWSVFEATGDVASGDLSSALGTAVTGQRAGSSPSQALVLTLAALDSADSKVVGAFGNYNYSASTPGSGFTEIHDGNQNNSGLQTEYSTNDTTVDATAVSNYTVHAGVAVEVKAASAGISGSSSTTQDANTAAATGTLAVQGSASTTQGSNALSASGQISIQGAAAITQGTTAVAATGEGSTPITGSVSITQDDNVCAATGALAIQGSASIAQAGNTAAATGALAIQGGVSIGQAVNSVSATGQLAVQGSASAGQDGNALSATGVLAVSGTLSAVQGQNAVTATGQLPITGTASVTQAGNAVVAEGVSVSGNTGSVDVAQAANSTSATGSGAISGSLSIQLDDTTVAASGQTALTGSLSATQGEHSLMAIGQVPIIGTLAIQLDDTTVSAAATITAAATDSEKIALILKILANRQELDPTTGTFRLYDDDGATLLYEVSAWEDVAGTIPYRGLGLQKLDRLE